MINPDKTALVIGAGIAGSSLAYQLAKRLKLFEIDVLKCYLRKETGPFIIIHQLSVIMKTHFNFCAQLCNKNLNFAEQVFAIFIMYS